MQMRLSRTGREAEDSAMVIYSSDPAGAHSCDAEAGLEAAPACAAASFIAPRLVSEQRFVLKERR